MPKDTEPTAYDPAVFESLRRSAPFVPGATTDDVADMEREARNYPAVRVLE